MDIKKKMAVGTLTVLPLLGGGIAYASTPASAAPSRPPITAPAATHAPQQGADTPDTPDATEAADASGPDGDGPGGPNVQQGVQQGPNVEQGGPDAASGPGI